HIGGREPLEHGDLQMGLLGHHDVAAVPGQGALAVGGAGGGDRGAGEAADELAGHVLQRRGRAHRTVKDSSQLGSASRRVSAASSSSRDSPGMYQSWTTYSAA